MDLTSKSLILWSARIAAALYLSWIIAALLRKPRAARIVSTFALSVYLIHVWSAFQFLHQWSHAAAYRDTARQTAELFGVDWGGGLYLNYLFTALWLTYCAASWLAPTWWKSQPAWLAFALHVFLAFMWVNATIVVWLIRASH